MYITAGKLKAGQSFAFENVYIHIERVTRESHGMIAAHVRTVAGTVAPVLFHSDENVTVGA